MSLIMLVSKNVFGIFFRAFSTVDLVGPTFPEPSRKLTLLSRVKSEHMTSAVGHLPLHLQNTHMEVGSKMLTDYR